MAWHVLLRCGTWCDVYMCRRLAAVRQSGRVELATGKMLLLDARVVCCAVQLMKACRGLAQSQEVLLKHAALWCSIAVGVISWMKLLQPAVGGLA